MPGSETNAMTCIEVLAAVRALLPSKDFVWNGVDEDEDDRPATVEELQAGVTEKRRITAQSAAIRWIDWIREAKVSQGFILFGA